jgi:hypothetical protein
MVTAVQPLALLTIGAAGNQVKVSWSAALSNYVLQSRGSFASGISWTGVTAIPAIAGNVKSVIETNTGPAKYYRLKQ